MATQVKNRLGPLRPIGSVLLLKLFCQFVQTCRDRRKELLSRGTRQPPIPDGLQEPLIGWCTVSQRRQVIAAQESGKRRGVRMFRIQPGKKNLLNTTDLIVLRRRQWGLCHTKPRIVAVRGGDEKCMWSAFGSRHL